jgi:hypothetical protein
MSTKKSTSSRRSLISSMPWTVEARVLRSWRTCPARSALSQKAGSLLRRSSSRMRSAFPAGSKIPPQVQEALAQVGGLCLDVVAVVHRHRSSVGGARAA